jgi:hypothetical protein
MNEKAKFGAHPDAEFLNGFAEQALNTAERDEVLGHLAACARCREVVALAANAAAAERPAAVPWWKAWFPSRPLAWAPALALAAIAVLAVFVYVRHRDQTMEMARVETPVQPASEAGAAAPGPVTNELKPKQPGAAKVVSKSPAPPITPPQLRFGMVAQGYSQVEAKPNVISPDGKVTLPARPAVTGANDQALGANFAVESSQQAERATSARMKMTVASAEVAQQSGGSAAPAAAPAMRTMAAPPPPGSPMVARGGKAAALPGGLAVASSAAKGQLTVAIDAAGSEFLSRDGGVYWEAVKPQWTGRAVRVELKAQAGVAGTWFEITNDQNQIWTSTNGMTWTPR